MRQTENIFPRCSHLLVKHWEVCLLQGQPKSLQQCLAGSDHSSRQHFLELAGRAQVQETRLTCATHPFKQDDCEEMMKTAELSKDEQGHIYMAGYPPFVSFILFNHMALLLLTGVPHILLCH